LLASTQPSPRNPANGSPSLHVHEVGGVLFGQAARPLAEPCLGELLALGVRAAKRALEILATASLQLGANRFEDELAPVLLEPVGS
jgi:hypothetical protein